MTPQDAYRNLSEHSKQRTVVSSINALVEWDQQVYMPPAGLEHRGAMSAWLAKQSHTLATDANIRKWLDIAADGEWTEGEQACLREWKRSYDKATCLPDDLVEREATVATKAHESWREAREKNDFSIFADDLSTLVDISREKADRYGYKNESYDALLDLYQADMTVESVGAIFTDLRSRLVPLLDKILDWQGEPATNPFNGICLEDEQHRFCEWGARAIGFDFNAGRLDKTVHPFCTGTCIGDVRLTTRFDVNNPLPAFSGALHEAGHGVYEQGLLVEHQGTPLGDSVSLGVHESQSLFNESVLGQSVEFWTYALPFLKAHFPGRADHIDLDTISRFVNRVERSFIRVDADEVTYPLHVILRFEIERDLFRGDVAINDLPELWRTKMQELLGVVPDTDSLGVLQDVHWSFNGFGYFPTYALGRLYAAQLAQALTAAHPDWRDNLKNGDCSTALNWMRENVHRQGMRYRTEQLIERATGTAPSADAYLTYLEDKYSSIYAS